MLDLTDQRAVLNWMREMRPQAVFLAAARVGGILANNTMVMAGAITAAAADKAARFIQLCDAFDLPIISDTLFRRDTENGVTPVLKSDGPRIKQCVVNGVSYMDSMHHLPASLQANAVAFLRTGRFLETPARLARDPEGRIDRIEGGAPCPR